MAQLHDDETATAFDPVPLTLALWLGLIVGVTGFIRLADNAAADAAAAQGAYARNSPANGFQSHMDALSLSDPMSGTMTRMAAFVD